MHDKKINLNKKTNIPHHNGGWNFVLKILNEFHSDSGIFLDDIADMTFGNNYEYNSYNAIIPYKFPWVGFLHHPLNIAPWYQKYFQMRPDVMIETAEFKESLTYCKGIYTFSEFLSNWYREKIPGIRIECLLHPTIKPEKLFDIEAFRNNEDPKLITIGFFLRRLSSIFKVESKGFRKTILTNPLVFENLNSELSYTRYEPDFSTVKFTNYLQNKEYNALLSENIVFLDLFDCCANNIIVECIVRNTPVLVNKLESVVEYLGRTYPLYYNSLEEAEIKLNSKELLIETSLYLKKLKIKDKLSGAHFANSFYSSNIYQTL